MATLNLGRIKPVFRDAYSGSTAYVVDDIVTHGDECFICIQAHGAGEQATSQTAYWKKLAAKGTDGTDVGTTITTQGDILYRDGSGLQRLGAGTSGQFLKTQGTGANPVWGDVTANFVKRTVITNTTRYALASQNDSGTIWSGDFTKVFDDSVSAIDVTWHAKGFGTNSDFCGVYMTISTADDNHTSDNTSAFYGVGYTDNGEQYMHWGHKRFDSSNLDAGNHTLTWGHRARVAGNERPGNVLNPNSSDDTRMHNSGFYCFIDEIKK